jgi:hypothetical protein
MTIAILWTFVPVVAELGEEPTLELVALELVALDEQAATSALAQMTPAKTVRRFRLFTTGYPFLNAPKLCSARSGISRGLKTDCWSQLEWALDSNRSLNQVLR